MNDETTPSDFLELRASIRKFATERDWEKFHTPKNLASGICIEAAELLEPFQWLKTGDRSELGLAKLAHVQHEVADVLIYLVRLADTLDIDLMHAVNEKLALNRQKYPAEKVRGDSRKYDEYENE